jgi:cytidylate kinase
LGFTYLDTGAIYRSVALAALENSVSVHDEVALGDLTRDLDIQLEDERILVNGTDVSHRIRDADVTQTVSHVAAAGSVREALSDLQRRAAAKGRVVIEGRDIGSVVVPDAEVKVFLTASLQERARRRAAETGADPLVVERSIAERDEADSTRGLSPLAVATDAHVIDSTICEATDVASQIVRLVEAIGRTRG